VIELHDLAYPIVVAQDVRDPLAAFVRSRGARAIVLCDARVLARATELAASLGAASRKGSRRTAARVLPFVLGEPRKRLRTVEAVLEALSSAGADRGTLAIGVGGGVGGDLFGFAAALYMRGIAYVNVATSLVAMVDASIGGKTGVDLPAGKNLAGVFRDPAAVFCDVGSLATLPPRHLREGLAELIKHGIIEGDAIFEELEELAGHPLRTWPWERVVAESLRIKAMIVADDRLEKGAREVLNLGHTFGHAIERVTQYRTSHGRAVAVGLRAAGLLALRTGRFSQAEHLRVISLLALVGLPLATGIDDPDALLAAMASDKKTRDGTLRFVVPQAIGEVEFGVTAPLRAVRSVLARVRDAPGAAEFR